MRTTRNCRARGVVSILPARATSSARNPRWRSGRKTSRRTRTTRTTRRKTVSSPASPPLRGPEGASKIHRIWTSLVTTMPGVTVTLARLGCLPSLGGSSSSRRTAGRRTRRTPWTPWPRPSRWKTAWRTTTGPPTGRRRRTAMTRRRRSGRTRTRPTSTWRGFGLRIRWAPCPATPTCARAAASSRAWTTSRRSSSPTTTASRM
mmetsp:Transcript_43469/g.129826  ORF Transcript_43469/g.129826 Transcript_43469/m.129826 type:complete len:204 (-) Transcript_43469:1273-1884(-)